MATCCAAPARPSRLGELLAETARDRARPRIRVALPAPGAGRLTLRPCHLPLSDPARESPRSTTSRSTIAAGRDGRGGRALGRRQVDAAAARAALLRSAGRRACCSTASRWPTPIPRAIRARIAMVPQETVIFARLGARQSALRPLGRRRRRAVGRRRGRQRRDVPARAARWARHLSRRRRRAAVGRPAPARRDRARAAARRAAAAARRGDLGARRRERAAGPGRARPADAGPHDDGDRAPPRDRAQGRPHRRDGGGPHRRAGHARRSCSRAAGSMRGWRSCSSRWPRLGAKRRAARTPPPHRSSASARAGHRRLAIRVTARQQRRAMPPRGDHHAVEIVAGSAP